MTAAVLLTAWGASWVLVRSTAGGLVRGPVAALAALGHKLAAEGLASGSPPVTAAGYFARALTVPDAGLRCPGCTGFWTGIASSIALTDAGPLEAVAAGFASAGVCAVLDAVTGAAVTWIERNLHAA